MIMMMMMMMMIMIIIMFIIIIIIFITRLYPIAFSFNRRTQQDLVLCGYQIPAGVSLIADSR